MTPNFGKKLRDILLLRGISPQALADELGCSCESVHRWMRNETLPPLFSILRIMEITGKNEMYFWDEPSNILCYNENDTHFVRVAIERLRNSKEDIFNE